MADANARLNVLVSLKSAVQQGGQTLDWLKKFAGGLSAAGGAMAVFAAKQAVGFGAEIKNMADQANMGASALQVLALQGEKSGVKMADISKSTTTLRKNLQDAREGSAGMNTALKTLGLSAAGLQSLAPERQWEAIGAALNNATDKQAALNAVTDLFGAQNGPKLLSLLKSLGVDGYDKLADAAKGVVLTDEQIATLERAANAWQRIQTSTKMAAARVTAWAADNLGIGENVDNPNLKKARDFHSQMVGMEIGVKNKGRKLSAVQETGLYTARKGYATELMNVGGEGNLRLASEVLAKVAPKNKRQEEEIAQLQTLLDKRREAFVEETKAAELRTEEQAKTMAFADTQAKNEDALKKLKEGSAKAREDELKALYQMADTDGKLLIKQTEKRDLEAAFALEIGKAQMAFESQESINLRLQQHKAKMLAITAEIAGLEKTITEEGKKRIEDGNKEMLTRMTAATDRDFSETANQMARVDASPFLTEKQKRNERIRLLATENEQIEDQIKLLNELALAPGADQSAITGRIDNLTARREKNEGTIEKDKPLGVAGGLRKELVSVQNELGGIEDQLSRAFGSVMRGNIDAIAQGIHGLIDGTMTWGDALRTIGSSIMDSVINAISRMFAEWIVSRLLASKVSQAASVEEGATATIAAAPAATLTSIYSWGAAAAIGLAAVVAIMAAFGGFSGGGYTGAGGRYEPAGFVHKDEVVLESPIVAGQKEDVMSLRAALQAGVPARDLLAGAYGYSEGGYVGQAGPIVQVSAGAHARERGKRERPVRNIFVDDRKRAEELANDPAFDNRVVKIFNRRRARMGQPT